MAERAGVSPAVLRAVLADNPDAMPPDVALVRDFTRATLAHDAAADEYRGAIVKRWGRRALVVWPLPSAARIYPTVKYALDGKACMRVVVGGTPVMFDHGQVRRRRMRHRALPELRARCRIQPRASSRTAGACSVSPTACWGRWLMPRTRCRRYLRWHAARPRRKVSDPRAFLMTTTTRICLDMLTSARARREGYVGPGCRSRSRDGSARARQPHGARRGFAVALLLTLDRLSPLERAAFLLHDVFDFSFSEVARALERSETACRQLAARARTCMRAARPRGATAPPARAGEIDAKHAQLMSAFVAATRSGDLDALTQFSDDVRVVTDGGGKVAASLNVLDGADRAAQFLVGVTRKGWREDFTLRFATINGLPGVIVDMTGKTAAFEIEGDVIRAVRGAQSGQVAAPGGGIQLTRAGVGNESSRP